MYVMYVMYHIIYNIYFIILINIIFTFGTRYTVDEGTCTNIG
jgi:hypothetical protein